MSFDLVQRLIRGQLGDGRRADERTRWGVALVLADVANDDGTGIFLSIATIAARARCSRRSVEYVLREFESEGLIRRDGKRKCQGGAVTVWRIDAKRLAALPAVTVTANPVTHNGKGRYASRAVTEARIRTRCGTGYAPGADEPTHPVRTEEVLE